MSGNIWVIAEQWRGEVSEATYEVLALGRELADGLGVACEAVLMGRGVTGSAGTLGAADRVLVVEDDALADLPGGPASRAIAALAAERSPAAVLVPITNVSWDLLGMLPAATGGAFVNSCRDVEVAEGGLRAHCLMYGGKMVATVSPRGEGAVLAVLPGARRAEAGRVGGDPEIESVDLAVPPGPAARPIGYADPEPGDVDISQMEVLVGVGRGIGSDANLEVAQELADALGGAVCGSRPVIDQGWLGLDRQVGKSGITVKPRLYIAAGISGAPEHTEGMKDSELIVAVNTDPGAPIFSVAHYGVVEDATDLLEALAEAIEERKG
jgi:electron transfer flavoprotein alpha subunit